MKERKDLPFPHKNRTRGLKLRWVGCIYPNGAHNGQVKVRLSDRAKALAKLDSLLPQSSIIHITTEDHG